MEKPSEEPGGRKPGLNTSLKDAWTGNCDVLVLSHRNLGHLAALEKAYEDLYLPHFPPAEGYDSIDKWMSALLDPENSPVEYRITLAGENLRGEDGPVKIKGICVSMYFKDSDTGYLGYIIVDPASRTEGLGYSLFRQHQSAMVDAARDHGGELRGMYLDCHDPRKEGHDSYDPQKRVNKYVKWGGVEIDCDYRVPIVTRPGSKALDLTLIAFPHPVTGEYPTPETHVGFFGSIYKDNGVDKPEQVPHFQHMKKRVLGSAPRNDNRPNGGLLSFGVGK